MTDPIDNRPESGRICDCEDAAGAVAPAATCSPIFIPVDTIRGIEYAQIPTGMSEQEWDFMLLALKFYGEHHPTFVAKKKPEEKSPTPSDWVTCEYCSGSGHDGFDRSYPPNPYICGECDGKGKVSPETAASWPDDDIMERDEPSSPENTPTSGGTPSASSPSSPLRPD